MTKEQSGHFHLVALLLVGVAIVIAATGYAVWTRQKPAAPATVTTENSSNRTPVASGSASSGPSTADLNGDIAGANSAILQENADATNANGALNDSQNQITVPAN